MDFDELVKQVEDNPEEADFDALRRAYVASERYLPTAHYSYQKLKGNTNSAESFDEVVVFCQQRLDENPMDLEVRMMLDFAYEQLDQYDLAARHHAFVQGMLDAIYDSGDGKSLETAWHVVAVAEEYTVLSVLGLQLQEQALVEANGRYYDVLTCRSRRDGEIVELYFDVTAPYLYLGTMLE